jgi:hypothetical protein
MFFQPPGSIIRFITYFLLAVLPSTSPISSPVNVLPFDHPFFALALVLDASSNPARTGWFLHNRLNLKQTISSQCAKRHLRCQYPLTSRRGQRKPREQVGGADPDGALWGSPASKSPTPPTMRTNSRPRAQASSKFSTSSSLINAV